MKKEGLQKTGGELPVSRIFYDDVKRIISEARDNAVRSVEFHRVMMYWKLGERIFVEEQHGQNRAEYGVYLLKNLVNEIEPEFGSGFGLRQLERARKFYRIYPITTALRSQVNWYQYRLLITIDDDYKREYYELETEVINLTEEHKADESEGDLNE